MLNFKLIGDPLNCGSPSRKMIDPLVTAGIVAGAGSLLGSIFGGSSEARAQDRANQTNLQIARETNALNERLWNNQANFQTQMWNSTNAYNSPAAQKARLLQAGINPSAVFGNGSMAEASNLSAPSANPAVAAHVEPVNYMAGISQGISNGLNAFFDSQLKNQEIQHKGYENKILNSDAIYKDRLNAQNLKYLENMSKREDFLGEIARTDLAYYQAINGQRISQAFGATRMQNKQLEEIDTAILNKNLENTLLNIEIAYRPKLNERSLKQLDSTIRQINANIGLINANTFLTQEQRLSEIENRVNTIVDYNLKGLDYQIKRDTKKYVIGAAKESLYQMEDARFERPWNFYQKHLGRGANFLLTPGSSGAAGSYMDMQNSRDRWNHYDSRFRPRK